MCVRGDPLKAAGEKKIPLAGFILLERETGFEPATPTLARSCSTTELFPHEGMGLGVGVGVCKGRQI